MATKSKKRRNGKKGITLPMALIAGVAAPSVKIYEARSGGISGMTREAGRILTGFDFWNGGFNFADMRYGLLPIVGGVLVHWLVGGKLGLNRMMARAGIPFVRI